MSEEVYVLITKYLGDNRPDLIISLFDSLKSQRDRAEREIDVLRHEIKRLALAFANITEPSSGRKVTDRTEPLRTGQSQNPSVTEPHSKPIARPKAKQKHQLEVEENWS